MKQNLMILAFCGIASFMYAKEKEPKVFTEVDSLQLILDAAEQKLEYKTGEVSIGDNLAKIKVPAGFRFLGKKDAETVVYDLWGNPRGNEQYLYGLLVPENQKVTQSGGWAFVIEYDDMGYVKDDDADKINYDDLLKEMQSDEAEENKERTKNGFEAVHMVGWAQKPFYDKEHRVLHWAKEIKFGSAEEHTLNYNVRVLGRKGVLVLNAVGNMRNLPEINQNINNVLSSVEFGQGNKYTDFDPSVDKVAAWTIGGLVAGKVLAKVGVLAFLAKFAKVIFLAIAGGASALWRWIRGRKNDEEEQVAYSTTQENAQETV